MEPSSLPTNSSYVDGIRCTIGAPRKFDGDSRGNRDVEIKVCLAEEEEAKMSFFLLFISF